MKNRNSLAILLLYLTIISCSPSNSTMLEFDGTWYANQDLRQSSVYDKDDLQIIFKKEEKFTVPFTYGFRVEDKQTISFFRIQYPAGDSPCLEKAVYKYSIKDKELLLFTKNKEVQLKIKKRGQILVGDKTVLPLFPCEKR